MEWNRTWGPGFSSVQGMDIVYSPLEARCHFQLYKIQTQKANKIQKQKNLTNTNKTKTLNINTKTKTKTNTS